MYFHKKWFLGFVENSVELTSGDLGKYPGFGDLYTFIGHLRPAFLLNIKKKKQIFNPFNYSFDLDCFPI
jgi:hypothetical protein